jgi:predicted nucleic acid-binding Zn finger protein
LSEEKLDSALKNILRNKAISGKELEELATKYGERFWRALKIVAEHRVKQYVFEPSLRTMWIVVGKEKDYLVLSDFYCSCKDFYLMQLLDRKTNYVITCLQR